MKARYKLQVKIVLGALMMAGAYCLGALRVNLWPGWVYAVFFLVGLESSYFVTRRVAPDLMEDRVAWHQGVPRWDRWIVSALMFAPVVTALIAGLETHWHKTGSVHDIGFTLGYFIGGGGWQLTQSAMAVNPFYAPVVRIQSERWHKVIDRGPYRYVRHPGNLGTLILYGSAPLMLGSSWAWAPSLLWVVLIIVRTALEDRTLRRELPGYAQYTERATSRLIPGIW